MAWWGAVDDERAKMNTKDSLFARLSAAECFVARYNRRHRHINATPERQIASRTG